MADYNNADYAVQLPNQFPSPGQALQDLISSKERDLEKRNALLERQREQNAALEEKRREYDEKEKERQRSQADAYAKYVGEETKIPASLVTAAEKNGLNVTDQVGKAAGRLLGMIGANKNLSFAELQSEVSSKVRPMFNSLAILGEENKKRDAIIKEAKTLYPGINADALANDFDKDVKQRYFDENGNILPPQAITPSTFQQNITDPDYLSKYLTPTATGGLETFAKHPKGKEIPILAGTRDEHTTFKTIVPDWANINTTLEEREKNGGLMPSGFVPKLSVKGHEVPMPQLSQKYGEQSKPFMVAEDDAYQSLIGADPTHATQLAAIARREYPSGKGKVGFDEMNPTEKDLLKKHIAYKLMQSGIDSNPAYVSAITKTPKQNVNITNAAPLIVNPFQNVKELVDSRTADEKGRKTAPLNLASGEAQKSVVDMANSFAPKISIVVDGKTKEIPYTHEDIGISQGKGEKGYVAYGIKDGKVDLKNRLFEVDEEGLGSKFNTNAKTQQELRRQAKANEDAAKKASLAAKTNTKAVTKKENKNKTTGELD